MKGIFAHAEGQVPGITGTQLPEVRCANLYSQALAPALRRRGDETPALWVPQEAGTYQNSRKTTLLVRLWTECSVSTLSDSYWTLLKDSRFG